jgi:AcrR family transcriptional regulator
MPKGFNEREKDLIRKKMFKEGTRLFDQYGIQKTTVDEIAKCSGISKGSFYSFYNSKEEFFFDILESLDKQNKEKFSGILFHEGRSNRESFREFLYEIFDSIENTSIMKKMNPAELENLLRKLPEDRVAAHLSHDNEYFDEFFIKWKNKGIFKDRDPKGFTGTIKLIFYFVIHQSDYSPDEFKAAKEFLIDMLCDFIVKD